MKREGVAILGAGILGRSLAFRLAQEGFQVSVFERNAEDDESSASFVAAGMLAPFSELEKAPAALCNPGLESIQILKSWVERLSPQVWMKTTGSLVQAHYRDRLELKSLRERLSFLGHEQSFEETSEGLYFPREAHLHPKSLMQALLASSRQLGAEFYFSRSVSNYDELHEHQVILDCRGIAAKTNCPGLRGVRGEIIEVESTEVSLDLPVRLMHPRYPLYIVPRPQKRFVIGATMIESESQCPVTVRSAAELLSVALTVDSAFAEASIVSLGTQCRPAYPDHLPHIHRNKNIWIINGLYRHGFLLTPYITERLTSALISGDSTCPKLF